MKKQPIMEALQELKTLNEDTFNINGDNIEELKSFYDGDTIDYIDVYDPEAETKEELKDSYVGDVILCCEVCKSLVYKNPEEVVVDEETQIANIDDICPYCMSEDGYKIVGEVAPYTKEVEETESEEHDEIDEVEDAEELEENLSRDDLDAQHRDLYDYLKQRVKDGNPVSREELILELNDRGITGTAKAWIVSSLRTNEGSHGLKMVNELVVDDDYANIIKAKEKEDSKLSPEYRADKATFNNLTNEEVDALADAVKKAEVVISTHASEAKKKEAISKYGKENITWISSDKGGKAFSNMVSALIYTDPSKRDQIPDSIQKMMNQNGIISRLAILDALLAEGRIHLNKGGNIDESTTREPIKKDSPFIRRLKSIKVEDLEESFEEVAVTTDKETIKVESEGEGTKVEVQPRAEETFEEEEAEMIAPIQDETKDEIESEGEEQEVEFDEFDEEEFDELGEKYLREVYDNVKGYKTLNGSLKDNKLILEGQIDFKSGKKAKTTFVFEGKTITKTGKVKLVGINEQFAKSKNAFTITGRINGKKLCCESLTYKYLAEDCKTKAKKRLYNTVKR